MKISKYFNIDENSRRPKYIQIVDAVTSNISNGNFIMDEKMPSINMLSEEFFLSRDTVEKAYKVLKERKVINSVRGKGYYIARTKLISKINVLFLVNKLSSYKLEVYNSFNKRIGANVHTDLQVYHCDESLFLNLLKKYKGAYDYYIVMSHFKSNAFNHISAPVKVVEAIKKIPMEKLILLDNIKEIIDKKIVKIYQDFENDIYNSLIQGLKKIVKYNKVLLVYPDKSAYPYPKEIVYGFRKFCVEKSLDFEIIDQIYEDIILKKGDLFITIEENDLVYLIKQIRDNKFEIGKDIGVLSYNDTPLKDLLGISVVSTDFKTMGETAARMILSNKKGEVNNPFKFINRNSM
ncbi:MAG: GntR family transcriptional regulator [Flavobacteriaceae bacterium]|nr:GntR family transcriptional regulator [Flavobacteriaceae bacterium]